MITDVVAFSGPVKGMLSGTQARNDTLTISNILSDYIERNLAYADQIYVYAGVDLSDTDTLAEINKRLVGDASDPSNYPGLPGKWNALTSKWSDNKNRSYALVFHYEEDTNNPAKSGYRLYEIMGGSSVPSSFTTDQRVFNEEFYDRYSFFIQADEDFRKNTVRNKDYMKLTINSYHFDGSLKDSTTGSGATDTEHTMFFQSGAAASHYEKLDNLTDSTKKDYTEKYESMRTNSESVFFSLENKGVSTASFTYRRGFTKASGIKYGDDVVILYNITKFNHKSS